MGFITLFDTIQLIIIIIIILFLFFYTFSKKISISAKEAIPKWKQKFFLSTIF